MRLFLLTTTFIAISCFLNLAHAVSPGTDAYHCTPRTASAPYDLKSVDVRKDPKTNTLTSEVKFSTSIATISYATEVTYLENPNFAFPEWDGNGMNFIIEKKAKNFSASEFTGTLSGNTPDFAFSANLDCKLVQGAKSVSSTSLSKN